MPAPKSRPSAPFVRTVASCDDCPCLYENGEYPETSCRLDNSAMHGKLWGFGDYERGDPAPKGCPLRRGAATIVMRVP